MIETIPVSALQNQMIDVLVFDPVSFQITAFALLAIGFITGIVVRHYVPAIRAKLTK